MPVVKSTVSIYQCQLGTFGARIDTIDEPKAGAHESTPDEVEDHGTMLDPIEFVEIMMVRAAITILASMLKLCGFRAIGIHKI